MGEEGYTCISIRTCPCIKSFYMLWFCLVVFLVIILAYFDKFLFVFNSFKCFLFYQFLLSFVSKIKKYIKSRKSKSLIGIIVFYHTHVLPCTFIQMALCIYECSLFSMHSYHYGKSLDIYVIVVNKSSNLSWMISQWLCWSWDLHRLVPIYHPTFLFFFLNSSTNVKSQSEKI